jgi:hypothetical protein
LRQHCLKLVDDAPFAPGATIEHEATKVTELKPPISPFPHV